MAAVADQRHGRGADAAVDSSDQGQRASVRVDHRSAIGAGPPQGAHPAQGSAGRGLSMGAIRTQRHSRRRGAGNQPAGDRRALRPAARGGLPDGGVQGRPRRRPGRHVMFVPARARRTQHVAAASPAIHKHGVLRTDRFGDERDPDGAGPYAGAARHPRRRAVPEPAQRVEFVGFRRRQARRPVENGHRVGAAHPHPAARLERLVIPLGDLQQAHSHLCGDGIAVGVESHPCGALVEGLAPGRWLEQHRLRSRSGGQRELQFADPGPGDPHQRQRCDRDADRPPQPWRVNSGDLMSTQRPRSGR